MDEGMRFLLAQRARKELVRLHPWKRWRFALGAKILLGKERWSGWTGELPVYLFRCPGCRKEAIDYPHGFIQNRYLLCSHCNVRISFVPWWIDLVQFYELFGILWRCRNVSPERRE